MKVLSLKAKNYRSLRDVSIKLEDFNLFSWRQRCRKEHDPRCAAFSPRSSACPRFRSAGVYARRYPQSCVEG